MGDFIKNYFEDITILVVNLSRATLKEAIEFKYLVLAEIDKGCKKLIVDLSDCSYMDSTFLGTIVVALKKITSSNGKMALVSPNSSAYEMLYISGTLKLFENFSSLNEAIDYFEKSNLDSVEKDVKNVNALKENKPAKPPHNEPVRTSKSTF